MLTCSAAGLLKRAGDVLRGADGAVGANGETVSAVSDSGAAAGAAAVVAEDLGRNRPLSGFKLFFI